MLNELRQFRDEVNTRFDSMATQFTDIRVRMGNTEGRLHSHLESQSTTALQVANKAETHEEQAVINASIKMDLKKVGVGGAALAIVGTIATIVGRMLG